MKRIQILSLVLGLLGVAVTGCQGPVANSLTLTSVYAVGSQEKNGNVLTFKEVSRGSVLRGDREFVIWVGQSIVERFGCGDTILQAWLVSPKWSPASREPCSIWGIISSFEFPLLCWKSVHSSNGSACNGQFVVKGKVMTANIHYDSIPGGGSKLSTPEDILWKHGDGKFDFSMSIAGPEGSIRTEKEVGLMLKNCNLRVTEDGKLLPFLSISKGGAGK
ncbi:MAG: hypothetical protein HN370_06760 [Phycisphaerales bacterium]|jgi:hypothetical protein|nr:hypothetical protein [Phycisphaerales bacterium]